MRTRTKMRKYCTIEHLLMRLTQNTVKLVCVVANIFTNNTNYKLPTGVDNVVYNSNRLSSFRSSLRNRFRHSFRQRSENHRRSAVSTSEHRNVCKRDTSIRVQLNSVSQIDRVSRLVFPIAYLLMNFVYW